MSRRSRSWILLLILIPVAVYGTAKLAIWYSVKDALDNLRATMAPVATLEHSRILSPVFGPFGVTGIRITPHIFDDEITVGSALVHIDDPVEKYKFLSATLRDTIPTSFNFSLNGVRIPLQGDIARWLDQAAALSRQSEGATSGCQQGAVLTSADLRKMGYEELLADVAFDYGYDRREGGLTTYTTIKVHDMIELVFDGKIPQSEVVFKVDRMDGVPKLSDLSIAMRDLSWSSRFNSFCADKLGITDAQYAQKRLSDTRQSLVETGFEPSDALMNALQKFSEGEAQLTLSLNPRDPINPTQVNLDQDPEFLIDELGIEVLVDGKPIGELGEAKEVAMEETQDEKQAPLDETYKPTSLQELPQYIKSSIQIHTADGKLHEGYLDSVDREKIVLTRELVGGSATFDVSRADVEKILVLRP